MQFSLKKLLFVFVFFFLLSLTGTTEKKVELKKMQPIKNIVSHQ